MTGSTINKIQEYLDELIPNPKCELNYNKDYELLIATMLSAQTTDKKDTAITGGSRRRNSSKKSKVFAIRLPSNRGSSMGLWRHSALPHSNTAVN